MSGSALMVWDLPLTVRVNRWAMAFSSLNQIAGPAACGGPTQNARHLLTLAGQRLVPQTAVGNARRCKIDVNIAGISARSEAGTREELRHAHCRSLEGRHWRRACRYGPGRTFQFCRRAGEDLETRSHQRQIRRRYIY